MRLQRPRRLACQNSQAVPGLGHARLQRRDLGTGLFAGGAGLLHFQRCDQTGLGAPIGNLQGLLLVHQAAARNHQLSLLAAQLDIGQCHLRRD